MKEADIGALKGTKPDDTNKGAMRKIEPIATKITEIFGATCENIQNIKFSSDEDKAALFPALMNILSTWRGDFLQHAGALSQAMQKNDGKDYMNC